MLKINQKNELKSLAETNIFRIFKFKLRQEINWLECLLGNLVTCSFLSDKEKTPVKILGHVFDNPQNNVKYMHWFIQGKATYKSRGQKKKTTYFPL